MRTAATFVLWLVAVGAVLVTVPTAWVATHVADEDGYVAFTQPFATDPELQRAVAEGVSQAVADEVQLPVAGEIVSDVVDAVVGRLVEQPGFPVAWADAQRSSHRLMFDDEQVQDRLVIDIGPILALVGDGVEDELRVGLDLPQEVVVPVSAAPDPAVLDGVEQTPRTTVIGLVVAAAAALGALVLARRRSTTLAWLGLGAAGAAGVLMLATSRGVPEVLDRAPAETPLATTMRDLLVARATESLDAWLLVLAAVGGVVAVTGLLARLVAGRR